MEADIIMVISVKESRKKGNGRRNWGTGRKGKGSTWVTGRRGRGSIG